MAASAYTTSSNTSKINFSEFSRFLKQVSAAADRPTRCGDLRPACCTQMSTVSVINWWLGLERYRYWGIGYWVLANTCQYWVVLVLVQYFS